MPAKRKSTRSKTNTPVPDEVIEDRPPSRLSQSLEESDTPTHVVRPRKTRAVAHDPPSTRSRSRAKSQREQEEEEYEEEDTPRAYRTVQVKELSTIPTFTGPKLKRSSNNWEEWTADIEIILRKYRAEIYVTGEEYEPTDRDLPAAWTNWHCNHTMICGFLLEAIDPTERRQFRDYSRANTLWDAIAEVFDREGPLSKVELFAKILSKPFNWNSPILDQYRTVMDNGVDKIFASPVPSTDDIGLMVLLYLLNNSDMADELRSARTAILYKPATSRTDILQQLINSERDRTNRPSTAFALATTSSKPAPSSSSAPSTSSARPRCENCSILGHEKPWCIRQGGGMEGKTLEEVRGLRGKKKKKGGKFNVNGKKFLVDPESGALFAEVSPSKLKSVTAATENLSSFVADSMCQADIDELANSVGDAVCGVDITELAGIASLFSDGFLLDSGCTVHMSPHSSDFVDIRSTTDRKIRGINGSPVDAKGVGDIHLRVSGSDSVVVLKDALYVPEANVRLVSVAALTEDVRGSVVFGAREVKQVTATLTNVTDQRHRYRPTSPIPNVVIGLNYFY